MQNYIQPGNVLTLVADRDVASGGGFQRGSIFGVATAAVLDTASGEFTTTGVYSLAKTTAQAWEVGEKVYWDDSNFWCDTDGTVGMLIGTATAVAVNPSSTGYVRLNGSAPSSSEGPQAAVADLTDNSGGATADGTIGAVAAPTALTDNGGGTADGTVASMAASTAPTVGTLTGTANGAMEVVGATNGGDVSGAIMNNFEELRAFADTVATWQAATQNNVKELTTTQGENRLAIIALTDAVKELSAKINTTLTRLRLAGVIIS
jgi:predicted RecA/RadA family phage recombinase